MDVLNAKEVSALCVSCGMCCDGTLFEKATIRNSEDKQLAINLNMTPIEKDGKPFFKLPCHLFDKCCTVYNKIKPNVCGSFFCVPLKNYQKGEIIFDLAESQVLKLLNVKKAMHEKAEIFEDFRGLNWPDFLLNLEAIINNPKPNELQKYGFLIILYTAFKAAQGIRI